MKDQSNHKRTYHIEDIDLFIREMPEDRMVFSIGGANAKRRPRAILMVRLHITDDRGRRSWGVAGDRPSFGWLDKRNNDPPETKLQRLFELVQTVREIYLTAGKFSSPFSHWRTCYQKIQQAGQASNHETLSASYASALFERAMIDAVCRLQGMPFLKALKQGILGFDAGTIFPDLRQMELAQLLPAKPLMRFFIRHTIGLKDPLTAADVPPEKRIRDGEPETLAEYIKRDGLRFFKIKIGGNREQDLKRLGKIWQVLLNVQEPVVTLDGNESYRDLDEFTRFVHELEDKQLGLFQHIEFIEQPLARDVTLDPTSREATQKLAREKDLVIDEADGTLTSFRDAFGLGYAGVSHKNCKGVFKSLLNYCHCHHFVNTTERRAFQTGEDLSNMPLVPLQQDFVALGVLGIPHCERNGHHYSFGLKHLSPEEKQHALKHHPDLYTKRDGELFVNIRNGLVRCDSLANTPFGVAFEPNWQAMTPLKDWTVKW